MFTYSKKHAWQGDPAVQQILVFASGFRQKDFENRFKVRVGNDGIEDASDSNIGAIYKLRAVFDGDKKYIPIIRCGVSGESLWEGRPVATVNNALVVCLVELTKSRSIPEVFCE